MRFNPVAIVAADCILPGASNLEEFYANNEQSRCSIRHASPEFWGSSALYNPTSPALGQSYTDLGGFLEPWELDSKQFRMPPRVLQNIDPVHQLALELARRVIGQCEAIAALPHEETAVILANMAGGVKTKTDLTVHLENQKWSLRASELLPEMSDVIHDYATQTAQHYPHPLEDASVNAASATIGGRIANYFNFLGPHYSFDAACASSLTALHAACLGLHQGDFKAALVGAVSLLAPEGLIISSKAKTLSASGCLPFDKRADGIVTAEGGIMVILLPLQDARRLGYPIKGIIRSIGYSCNGRTTVSWAPSTEGEAQAIRTAFEQIPFDYSQVDYVEAHGTATSLGDATELDAMLATYGSHPRSSPLPFGSVKSMLGHLAEGAGLAGILRALFVFERHQLPPTVNVERPRDCLLEADCPLQLQTKVAPCPPVTGRPRRVGISTFGYGGINYHALLEEDSTNSLVTGIRPPEPEPIAIVAMSAVVPDAPDIERFWQNLCCGHVSSHDLHNYIPMLDTFLQPAPPLTAGTYLDRAAIVERPAFRDYPMFRLLPKLIDRVTTEQLLLMQAVAAIVHQLGERFTRIDPMKAGCLIGHVSDSDAASRYLRTIRFPAWFQGLSRVLEQRGLSAEQVAAIEQKLWQDPALEFEQLDEDTSISFGGSILASRVAAGLDFRGKSYVVRSACATGLTVVSLAMQELRQHTLDFVICGATSMGLDITNHSGLAAMQALSHHGQGRPYDKDSDGFILGSGSCAVALKRLSDAERDHDDIIAVVREASGGSDGKGRTLLAPNVVGRQTTMRRVYERTQVAPQTVQYLEGHGASTPVGDKSEIDAIADVLNNEHIVYVGSVKGNIGHLKAAAGIAALIKTALCLHHQTLVPSGGYRVANPDLQLEKRRMEVLTQTIPWPSNGNAPRRAAINAFGLAGNNYHALLEEYIPASSAKPEGTSTARIESPASKQTALWTATSREDLCQQLQRYLDSGQKLQEIGTTDAYRVVILYDDDRPTILTRRVQSLLRALKENRDNPFDLEPLGIFYCWPEKRPQGRVCYLFPGQGSQYEGMTHSLRPYIRGLPGLIAQAAAAVKTELPDFYRHFWLEDLQTSRDWLSDTTNCQVATLVCSQIMARWLDQLGIQPGLLLGHSFGEFSALALAGSISFEDSVRLAYWRGRIAMEQTQMQDHAMAVLFTSPERLTALLKSYADQVFLANHNSSTQVVIAGMKYAVEQVLQVAAQQQIDGKLLPISRAFHSPLMEPVVAPFRQCLGAIPMTTPRLPVYRNINAKPYPVDIDEKELKDSLALQYITGVDYISMVEHAYAQGARIFIEVGPKRALTDLAKETLGEGSCVFIPLIHPKGGEAPHLLRAWARLWTYGITNIVPPHSPAPSGPAHTPPSDEKSQVVVTTPQDVMQSLTNGYNGVPPVRKMLGMLPEVRSALLLTPTIHWAGKRVLIIADVSGLADELSLRLQQAGAMVTTLVVRETITLDIPQHSSNGTYINLTDLDDQLSASPCPDWLFFLPGYSLKSKHGGNLHPYHAIYASGILAVLRLLFARLGKIWAQGQEGHVVVATRLDGRLGHTKSQRSNPLGGALHGALRALKMEVPTLRTCIIDCDPFKTPSDAAQTVLHAAASTQDHLEVGAFGQELVQTVLCPTYDSPECIPGSSDPLPLSTDSTVVVTGGARGVTAQVVEALAREVPCRYVIIGKTEPVDIRAALGISKEALLTLSPEELHEHKMKHFKALRNARKGLTPAQFDKHWRVIEKSLEITRTIAHLRDTGAKVEYVALDITDALATRTFCQQLNNSGYRIDGLIHGAAVEKSKLVWDQDPEQWNQTLATKINGFANLQPLLGPHTRLILLFSSIAGTFGGYGQTDYSAGSEYLNRLAQRLSADLPQARVRSIAWPAWGEVGLAMRETSQLYFKAIGLHYMSVSEGIRWALAALRSPYCLPELVVSYRDIPVDLQRTRQIACTEQTLQSQPWKLVQSCCPTENGTMQAKWIYTPSLDYYLHDHRVNSHSRLPAVHFIEHIMEVMAVLHPHMHVDQINTLSIEAPCVLSENRQRQLFVEVEQVNNTKIYNTRIFGNTVLPDNTWVPQKVLFAQAQVTLSASPRSPLQIQISKDKRLAFDAEVMRQRFAQFGVQYGPAFERLEAFYAHPDYAYCASLREPTEQQRVGYMKSFYDVALLDGACQSLAYLFNNEEVEGGLPTGFDSIKIFATAGHPIYNGYALAPDYGRNKRLDLTITNEDGDVVMIIEGLQVTQPVQGAL